MVEGRQKLQNQYEAVAEGCIECGLCRKDCLFLKKYGSPQQIAANGLESKELLRESFECSLCTLCTAVCPKDIDPAGMFHAMRICGGEEGLGQFKEHGGILSYERWGMSSLFSWYGLPQNCDTVFFPGCAMQGTRAKRVGQVYEHLRQSIPGLGLVLDCCTKPSHDLGRTDFFNQSFGAMKTSLLESGVKKVLVACPSCYRVWKDYGEGLEVATIYEHLADNLPFPKTSCSGTVTIHDPCAVRNETEIHKAVRKLVTGLGIEIQEMKHHGRRTVCCGEGGMVGGLAPDFASNWTKIRSNEADNTRIITYCAGCTHFIGKLTATDHITDLIFEPEKTLKDKIKVTTSPMTWMSRLLLKKKAPRLVKPLFYGGREGSSRIALVK